MLIYYCLECWGRKGLGGAVTHKETRRRNHGKKILQWMWTGSWTLSARKVLIPIKVWCSENIKPVNCTGHLSHTLRGVLLSWFGLSIFPATLHIADTHSHSLSKTCSCCCCCVLFNVCLWSLQGWDQLPVSEELLIFMNEPLHTVRKAQWKAQQYAILKILVNSSTACQVKSLLVLHHPTCKKRVMNSLS